MNNGRIWGTLDPWYESGSALGRRVANAQFLRAFLRADPFEEYHFFLADGQLRESLSQELARLHPETAGRIRVLDRRELPHMLATTDYHCFHQSDCILHQTALARLRNRHAREAFPVTGVTHSLSYADFGRAFHRHLWAGATPRDCVVATSEPGREAVLRFFSFLRRECSISAGRIPGPSVERVPLGVDPGQFSAPDRSGRTGCTFLVFGRISHFSKMDLLPLLRAFQSAFADGLDKSGVRLVLAGWADEDDDFPQTIRGLAENIGLTVELVLRPDDGRRKELFAEADVFVSVSDNPQETFGITVLEAGVSGLPVIVSDYDGYRELCVDGETGLRVPTIGPESTAELDDLAPLLFDNQYHLLLAQRTAVSVPHLARALSALATDEEQRLRLGAAGRERVFAHYTWDRVVQGYLALWDHLWAQPADIEALRDIPHPTQIPYGEVFGHYCTSALSDGTQVVAGRTGRAVYRKLDNPIIYAGLDGFVSEEQVRKLPFFARNPVSVAGLCLRLRDAFPGLSEEGARALLLWGVKHDMLEIVAD